MPLNMATVNTFHMSNNAINWNKYTHTHKHLYQTMADYAMCTKHITSHAYHNVILPNHCIKYI